MTFNKYVLIIILFLTGLYTDAQTPFHKGVNITNWFQSSGAQGIQFRKYTKKDFSDIKSLGCDVIRLPVNLHGMTFGSPEYIIDPLLFTFLDSTVRWAEELQINLIIDNHSFDPSVNTSPDVVNILTRVWPQIAERYKNNSMLIWYEILNEPHGISNALWGSIQQQTIDAIRAVDQRHTIIVGPSGYNSYHDLDEMPHYADTNLLYTFHFYDPFIFTHQGASWVTPSMEPLAGVPFPYDADSMPECPSSLQGSWIEAALNNYTNDGTIAKVKSLIDIAVEFKTDRNVDLFCGEFGVYIPNSDAVDRVEWYHLVRTYLEEKDIPWTIWDYKGSFGLFEKGSNEFFENDLNVPLLEALGLIVPEQSVYVPYADSVGFALYDDFFGKGMYEASWAPDTLSYYSETYPNNGKYCIYMADGAQYHSVAFDFVPDRDLSKLVADNYALDFFVRGNDPNIQLDLRFLDTKTGADDHPWRIRTTISNSVTSFDKRWHHMHIPLNSFTEQGSWDNGQWYNPQGLFDWSAVDRFEIVAEHASLDGQKIWFDNIFITELDTAQVHETATLGIAMLMTTDFQFTARPNPFTEKVELSFFQPEKGAINLTVYTLTNQKVKELLVQTVSPGYFNVEWDGHNASGQRLPAGIYLCRLSSTKGHDTIKIVLSD
ncbi:MAG: putative glycoside hydrolase family protein [Bacteroidetes bacterium]|nr:MAG: putative glycoside hydrolase family protein [Bacteroidota bacterium]